MSETETHNTHRIMIVVCACLFSTFVAGGVFWYGGNASGDDTFIYMRYVHNFLMEGEFVYNSGEQSQGVTSSLWPLLMVPVSTFLGNTLDIWKLSSVVLTGFSCIFFFLSFRLNKLSLPWTLFLTLVILCEPHNLRWNSSGMENALVFFLLSLLAFLGQLIRNIDDSGSILSVYWATFMVMVAGLLPFARPELGLFSVGIVYYCMLHYHQKRHKAFIGLAYLATLGFLSVLTYMAFGGILPQTAEAKAFLLKQVDPWYGIVKALKIIGSGSLGALVIVLTVRAKSWQMNLWKYLTLGSLCLSVAYLGWVNQIISSRYASYLSLPLVIAAVFLVAEQRLFSCRWIRACLVVQVCLSAIVLFRVFPVTRISESTEIRRVAKFVKANTLSDSRIALSEIGAFGFYSERYIIDLLGLTDRKTLAWKKRYGRPQNIEAFEKMLIDRQATHYIDANAGEQILQGQKLDFSLLAEFQVKRNIFYYGNAIIDRWRIYEVRENI